MSITPTSSVYKFDGKFNRFEPKYKFLKFNDYHDLPKSVVKSKMEENTVATILCNPNIIFRGLLQERLFEPVGMMIKRGQNTLLHTYLHAVINWQLLHILIILNEKPKAPIERMDHHYKCLAQGLVHLMQNIMTSMPDALIVGVC